MSLNLIPIFGILLILSSARVQASVSDFEVQMDRVQEGILRMIDEKEKTPEGTVRYQDLVKNTAILEGDFTKAREHLTQLETQADSKSKAQLEQTVTHEIDQMKSALEEVRNR